MEQLTAANQRPLNVGMMTGQLQYGGIMEFPDGQITDR